MKFAAILSLMIAGLLALTGCRGVPTPGERQARRDLQTITVQYQPENASLPLPALTPDSSLSNYLAFALLNSPQVKAAFYDWSASVENITVARSLPDPQLTLQAYLTDRLTSLMPGLAWNMPGPGKLKVKARIASAESDAKYFAFESAVLAAAFDFKKACYNLELLDEQLRINGQLLRLLDNLDRTIRAQNETGQGTLADVLRVQTDRDRLHTDLDNLADSRLSLLANFKAALGLPPSALEPPVPAHFEIISDYQDADELLQTALARNPQLKALQAEVNAATSGIVAAYKERTPDFTAGVSAEVYQPPFFWPQAGMTLPVWRDKLAAELTQAKAGEMAAQSRLTAAQIDLAVSFAEKSFACRETRRNVALIENQLIPQARQSLAMMRAGYRSGTTDFAALTEAERLPLDLELAAAEARTAHELALAELELMVSGVAPPGAPVLSATR